MKIKMISIIKKFAYICFFISPIMIISICNTYNAPYIEEPTYNQTNQSSKNHVINIVEEEYQENIEMTMAINCITNNEYQFIKSYSYSNKVIFDIKIKDNIIQDRLIDIAEYITYITRNNSILCLVDYNNPEQVICYIDSSGIERI